MKKIITLILVLFFLSGCSVSLPNSGKGGFDIPDYKTGYNGLDLEIKNSIDEIYINDYVLLNLQLLNNGGYEINNGVIKIAIDEDYLASLGDTQKDFSLGGKSVSAPDGEGQTISFTIKAKEIEEFSLEQNANIYFTGCYNYQTELAIDVCIDADIYQIQENKVCEPNIEKTSGGQGAPLSITEVETKMVYNDEQENIMPTFLITIKNKGSGTVFRENYEQSFCSPTGIDQNDLNVIDVEVEINHNGGMYNLACTPEGDIKLIDNERKIICKDFEGFSVEDGTFQTPLNIKLRYGYAEIISEDIQIKKLQ
ncbi:MAG: membrane lipoprotein lipid attachment site-containing protein [Nanoarchaeota archaeon]|nr:membrane lipoprotein lipid attachment site-containing protein [Nanoarchaeota archaeon]